MLETLDRIDWENLRAAPGSAREVPLLLRQLASPDLDVAQNAFEQLENLIHHQFTVYEATLYTVPFLIELLKAESVHAKGNLLELLYSISLSRHKDIRPPFITAPVRNTVDDILHERIYEAVRAGLSDYLPFLRDKSPQSRITAAKLLALFEEDAESLAPLLRSLLENESNIEVKIDLVQSLGRLLKRDQNLWKRENNGYKSLFADLVTTAGNNLVRFRAACTLAMLEETETSGDVVRLLMRAIAYPEMYATSFSTQIVVRSAAEALTYLGRARGIAALVTAFRAIADPMAAELMIEVLLSLAFPDKHVRISSRNQQRDKERHYKLRYTAELVDQLGEKDYSHRTFSTAQTAEEFDAEQRVVLTTIVDCDIVWAIDSNLLELYGLPTEREQLQILLK